MKIVVVEKSAPDGSLRPGAAGVVEKARELGEVRTVGHTGKQRRSTGAVVAALAPAVGDSDLVLIGATPNGRDVGARLAAKLGRAYAGEVTGLEAGDGFVTVSRSMYAGKVRASVRVPLPAVVSVRPNAFPAEGDVTRPETVSATVGDEAGLEFVRFAPSEGADSGRVSLGEAKVIVSAGRGLKGPENWKLVDDLADALGAATGASRAVTDAGWRPNEEQIGQTGKTVSPDLYVALGISGAIQHLAGMTTSKVIVAVNKDPDADIFKICDYGVVADLFDFVPKFTEEVKKVKAAG